MSVCGGSFVYGLEEKSIIACFCVGSCSWCRGWEFLGFGRKLGVALVVVINNSPELRWCVALGSSRGPCARCFGLEHNSS